jgi:hypothetical protein
MLSSQASAFKLGTESLGDFENILFSNSVLYDTGGAGISLLMVDGAVLDGVGVSNITMENVSVPIFIRLGNRARALTDQAAPGMGALRNIVISGVQARGAGPIGCGISGIPGGYIENLTLRDIRIAFAGGGTTAHAEAKVPDKAASYPSGHMFGILPAYGFFVRHVRNLTLDGIDLRYDPEADEARPALLLDDVKESCLSKLRMAPTAAGPAVRMRDCTTASVQPPYGWTGEGPWLLLEGASTADIAITGPAVLGTDNAVLDKTVPEGALR